MNVARGMLAGFGRVWRTALRLRPWLRGQWWVLGGAWLAMVLGVAARVLEPWPLKWLFDRVLTTPAPTGRTLGAVLAQVVAGMLVLALLRAGLGYVASVGMALAGNRALSACRAELFAHLLALDLGFHASSRRGDLLTRVIGDVGRVQEIAATAVLPLLTHTLTLAGMVGVMLWMDPWLGLIALGVIPAMGLVSGLMGRRIRANARDQRRREGDLASLAGEALGAMRVVQAYDLAPALSRRFAARTERSLRDGAKGARLSAGLERGVDMTVAAATAGVVLLGAWRALHGAITPGDLVVFLSYLRAAFRPVRDGAKFTGRLAKAGAAAERIFEVLDREPRVRDRAGATPLGARVSRLRFEGVSFSYGDGRVALRGASFEFERGRSAAVVGPSGSGKSTILNLAARLYDPSAGVVRVDDRDVKDVTLASLRSRVALVLQESVLLSGTVREAIAAGRPGASDAEVREAARSAGAEGFIGALPEGYETDLAERGESISGGQRQRLALARALLRKADILLLDEPTTGLDDAAREEVLASVRAASRDAIVVMVTHDLSAASRCDDVLRVEDGRVEGVESAAEPRGARSIAGSEGWAGGAHARGR